MSMAALLFQKRNENAKAPKKGSEGAAGYDLSSCEEVIIPARSQRTIDTGIAICIPQPPEPFYGYARIAPRSGLAHKNCINVGGGVIDRDYKGNLKVILFNHSDSDFHVKVGDRIAQLILEVHLSPEVQEVDELGFKAASEIKGKSDLPQRGGNGFGSTGLN
jgi:dUTP pyrophosphatase